MFSGTPPSLSDTPVCGFANPLAQLDLPPGRWREVVPHESVPCLVLA